MNRIVPAYHTPVGTKLGLRAGRRPTWGVRVSEPEGSEGGEPTEAPGIPVGDSARRGELVVKGHLSSRSIERASRVHPNLVTIHQLNDAISAHVLTTDIYIRR